MNIKYPNVNRHATTDKQKKRKASICVTKNKHNERGLFNPKKEQTQCHALPVTENFIQIQGSEQEVIQVKRVL